MRFLLLQYTKSHLSYILFLEVFSYWSSGLLRGWGGVGVFKPYEIPKALQNRAKFKPIVKTLKNC